MEKVRLRDYLNIAIEREIEAHAFYTELMRRTADKAARDALELLAGEELKHRAFLEAYRDGEFDSQALRLSDVIDYRIAEHMDKPDLEKDMGSAEIYLVAAHRELNAYNFYKGLAELHPEGTLRELFLEIAGEELRHKEKVEYLYSNTAFPQTDGG